MADRYPETSGVSRDAAAMMRFEANKRSALIAYILWFFLGFFGVHRFYLGRVLSGVLLLALSGVCAVISFLSFGFLAFLWVVPGIWLFIDIFLIPGMTRDYNNEVLRRII